MALIRTLKTKKTTTVSGNVVALASEHDGQTAVVLHVRGLDPLSGIFSVARATLSVSEARELAAQLLREATALDGR